MTANHILLYKNSAHLCAFFVTSVVKFYHRGHGDENTKDTETNIIYHATNRVGF